MRVDYMDEISYPLGELTCEDVGSYTANDEMWYDNTTMFWRYLNLVEPQDCQMGAEYTYAC